MNNQDAIEMLKSMLPKKTSYAELVGAVGCYGGGEYVYSDPEPYAIETAISALEKQITNGWIPVSERLPEENIDDITDDFLPYNVSLKFKYGECVRTYQFGQGRWWKNGDDMTAYVIAWQPLPPKYEEVSHG